MGSDVTVSHGYQFTLSSNALEYVGVVSGALAMTSDHVGVHADGKLTVSYSEGRALEVAGDTELFTLIYKVKSDTKLSEALSLSSEVTTAESYRSIVGSNDLMTQSVSLAIEQAAGSETEAVAEDKLYQNQPNP